MNNWIVLLRGINVGGNNILPMKELRLLLENLGCTNVATYIQSGNCVFQSADSDGDMLSSHISETIETQFGFRPAVMAMPLTALEQAIATNPYKAEGEADPKAVHFYFLGHPASAPDLDGLETIRTPSESYKLTDAVFYLHAPDGIGRSKLAAQIEKKLGVEATARNLRTVLKLRELAG